MSISNKQQKENMMAANNKVVMNSDGTVITMEDHAIDLELKDGNISTTIDRAMSKEEQQHQAKLKERQTLTEKRKNENIARVRQNIKNLKKAQFEQNIEKDINENRAKGETAGYIAEDEALIKKCETGKEAFKALVEKRKSKGQSA